MQHSVTIWLFGSSGFAPSAFLALTVCAVGRVAPSASLSRRPRCAAGRIMPMKDCRVLCLHGHSGAGKTTVLRMFINEINNWKAIVHKHSKGVTCPWLETDGVVVFGRWEGHHAVTKSDVAGRLDGCDRLHWNARGAAGSALREFKERGVRLVLCDGPRLTTQGFRAAAKSQGYAFDIVRLASSPRQSDRKKETREAGVSEHSPWHLKDAAEHRVMVQSEALAEMRFWAQKARGGVLPGGPTRRGVVLPRATGMRETSSAKREADAARKRASRAAMTKGARKAASASRRQAYRTAKATASVEAAAVQRVGWALRQKTGCETSAAQKASNAARKRQNRAAMSKREKKACDKARREAHRPARATASVEPLRKRSKQQ